MNWYSTPQNGRNMPLSGSLPGWSLVPGFSAMNLTSITTGIAATLKPVAPFLSGSSGSPKDKAFPTPIFGTLGFDVDLRPSPRRNAVRHLRWRVGVADMIREGNIDHDRLLLALLLFRLLLERSAVVLLLIVESVDQHVVVVVADFQAP